MDNIKKRNIQIYFFSKIIIFWGFFLTTLIIISPISIEITRFLPGLLIMWLSLILFLVGLRSKTNHFQRSYYSSLSSFEIINSKNGLSLVISITVLLLTPVYTYFYTGKNISDVIYNLVLGVSNYSTYQQYFFENSLDKFTIQKVPYILLNAIMKLLSIILFIRTLGYKKILNFTDYLSLFLISLSMIYITQARGTSFEIFELFILLIYSFALRLHRFYFNKKINLKNFVFIILFIIISVFIFEMNLENRGALEKTYITREMVFKNNLLSQLSPTLSSLAFRLTGYFSFGIYFVSTLLIEISFSSLNGLFSFILPAGPYLFYGDFIYRNLVCGRFIDCGAAWDPDIVYLFSYFGLLGTFLFVFQLGKISAKLTIAAEKDSIISSILLFYCVYFLLSLPVGNFISISSSNKIVIVISILFYFFPFLSKKIHNYLKVS